MASVRQKLMLIVLMAISYQALAQKETNWRFENTYKGDGTYYGYSDQPDGAGHCSFHFNGFGNAPGYKGVPLAVSAAQYTGSTVCGLCVEYRGIGEGLGGSPVQTQWQKGFVCDQCPECKFGDLDQQMKGDGRWKIQWRPIQCPVGDSKLKYGYQGGNPWYRKLQVANGRVPILSVEAKSGGTWQKLTRTIDNFHELHGDVNNFYKPCLEVRVTSVLGDKVVDKVCCKDGTCKGQAQFPCKKNYPGC